MGTGVGVGVVVLVVGALFACVVGVQITDLRVPASVRNGSTAAVLDCEYSLKQEEVNQDSGLVVKWFFNNGPAPVYQWIIGKKPQDLGILKGKLNLRYRASDNNHTMYRALYINHPTTELSGEYRCFVSTFRDEDFMNKRMIVFVPEKKFELTSYHQRGLDTVNVTCRAQGVYPEPKMALFKDPDRKAQTGLLEQVTLDTRQSSPGLFDIQATKVLEDADLQSPTVFECELSIPGTNYAIRKSTVYYPGLYGMQSDSGARQFNSLWIAAISSIVLLLISGVFGTLHS